MDDLISTMAEVFKAFGDPNRLRLLQLLASHPRRSLCVGALAERLDITQPAVSQHLKVLKHIRVVTPHKDGFRVHYTINTDTLSSYMQDMDALFKIAFEARHCHNCHE